MTTNTTLAFSGLATAAMLQAAAGYIGVDFSDWRGRSAAQDELLELLAPYNAASAAYAKLGWVKGFAAPTAEEVNRALDAAGSRVRLDPWAADDNHFGAVGLTDVLVDWQYPADDMRLFANEQWYPAFKHGNSPGVATLHDSEFGPLIEIQTKQGAYMRLLACDRPGSQNELLRAGLQLHSAELGDINRAYNKLVVPMVDLDVDVDVSGLLGLNADAPNGRGFWELIQAKAQTRFRMNQFGAHGQEEVAGGFELRSISMDAIYYLNNPFLVIIGDASQAAPALVTYVGREHWSDPGNLA